MRDARAIPNRVRRQSSRWRPREYSIRDAERLSRAGCNQRRGHRYLYAPSEGIEAPASSSASEGRLEAAEADSGTIEADQPSSAADTVSPPSTDAEDEPEAQEVEMADEPEPANDNSPTEQQAATGTE